MLTLIHPRESYGGHYGGEFGAYFESQNAAIKAGSVKGDNIDLVALGINNGWYDAAIQEQAYVDFSYNNTYKPIITAAQHTQFTNTNKQSCAPLLAKCTATTGSNTACENADNTCYSDIEGPLSATPANGGVAAYDFDVYDIREPSNDPYPPATYSSYLLQPSVTSAIGAKSTYTECANAPYNKFSSTGDGKTLFPLPKSHLRSTDYQLITSPRRPQFPPDPLHRRSKRHSRRTVGRRRRLDMQLVWRSFLSQRRLLLWHLSFCF